MDFLIETEIRSMGKTIKKSNDRWDFNKAITPRVGEFIQTRYGILKIKKIMYTKYYVYIFTKTSQRKINKMNKEN